MLSLLRDFLRLSSRFNVRFYFVLCQHVSWWWLKLCGWSHTCYFDYFVSGYNAFSARQVGWGLYSEFGSLSVCTKRVEQRLFYTHNILWRNAFTRWKNYYIFRTVPWRSLQKEWFVYILICCIVVINNTVNMLTWRGHCDNNTKAEQPLGIYFAYILLVLWHTTGNSLWLSW